MANEEKNVFDDESFEVEIEDIEVPVQVKPKSNLIEEGKKAFQQASQDDMVEIEYGELSNAEATSVQLEPEDVDKEFVIKSAEILKPLLRDAEGKPIPPLESKKDGKKYYKVKIKITYEGCSYVSLIPNAKWYITRTEKKITLKPWFLIKVTKEALASRFTAEISKLYYKYCEFTKQEVGKLRAQDFINGLVGKKVKLSQYKELYDGKMAYRIDIANFV